MGDLRPELVKEGCSFKLKSVCFLIKVKVLHGFVRTCIFVNRFNLVAAHCAFCFTANGQFEFLWIHNVSDAKVNAGTGNPTTISHREDKNVPT